MKGTDLKYTSAEPIATVDQLDLRMKQNGRGKYDTKIWVTEWVEKGRSGEGGH